MDANKYLIDFFKSKSIVFTDKNKSLLELELDSSKQAVIMGGDILAGQQCIERALSLKSNYNNY